MMISTCGRDFGSGSDSGSSIESVDERICEFFTSNITRSILDVTPVMFGTMKDGIMELLDERLGDLHAKVVNSQIGGGLSIFGFLRITVPHSSSGRRTLLPVDSGSLAWRICSERVFAMRN